MTSQTAMIELHSATEKATANIVFQPKAGSIEPWLCSITKHWAGNKVNHNRFASQEAAIAFAKIVLRLR